MGRGGAGEVGFLLTNSNLFFFIDLKTETSHTQHDAGMLMSLAFLKLLLSSWHCTLARDMVSLALIYPYTAGAGGENQNLMEPLI